MSGFLYKFGKAAFGLLAVVPMFPEMGRENRTNSSTIVHDMLTNGTLTIDSLRHITNIFGLTGGGAASSSTTNYDINSGPLSGFSSVWYTLEGERNMDVDEEKEEGPEFEALVGQFERRPSNTRPEAARLLEDIWALASNLGDNIIQKHRNDNRARKADYYQLIANSTDLLQQ
ncbi:MAG: hypothetical protein Q9212_001954 [Teloschistes hypoglaucus]